MITTVDDERAEVIVRDGDRETRFPLASAEGFAAVSSAWLRAGWDAKYVYSFTWLGRPIIQLPEDMFRLQEIIYRLKPDVIVETGIAHGGSLVFYAGLCKLIGRGRVIGIDLEIRPHNRAAVEQHALADMITMVEGEFQGDGDGEQGQITDQAQRERHRVFGFAPRQRARAGRARRLFDRWSTSAPILLRWMASWDRLLAPRDRSRIGMKTIQGRRRANGSTKTPISCSKSLLSRSMRGWYKAA